jgi:four helix bundle protein
MSRDYRKLRTFQLADGLALAIYRATCEFPDLERFGLQSQLRRAALSAASSLVEGSARYSLKEYLHFCHIAIGSASEASYLVSLAFRLGYLKPETHTALAEDYEKLLATTQALAKALRFELGLQRDCQRQGTRDKSQRR